MKNKLHTANAEMLIRKPVQTVFEAFIDPAVTTKFWFTHSTGQLVEGAKRTWTWEMYNLNVPVEVKKIEPNKKIIIEWGEGKQKSVAEWNFKSIGEDKTYVSIANYDFQEVGDELILRVVDSAGGFALVIAGLKAWLEHGIELNLIGDKFPKELQSE